MDCEYFKSWINKEFSIAKKTDIIKITKRYQRTVKIYLSKILSANCY